MVTRRTLLLSAGLAACSRKLAPRYQGWLFVASETDKGIVVADLAEFKRVVTIPLGELPGEIFVSAAGVFVTCPEARLVVQIDVARLRVQRRISLPGRIISAGLVGRSPLLAVLAGHPATLLMLDLASGKIAAKAAVPSVDAPTSLPTSLATSANMIAIAAGNRIVRFLPGSTAPAGETDIGTRPGPMLFRNDGKTILAAAAETREIVALDAASGGLLSRLPVAVAPRHMCFNADGGQMFVTGSGLDAVVIVNPYQNEIDQTVSAGHEPQDLAVQAEQGVLLVANTSSGNLTLLDIDTRRLAATVTVGGHPGRILVTPGGEYALAVSRDSGDVSVIRMATVLDRKLRTKPVFTVFPTGARPQSAVIVPYLR